MSECHVPNAPITAAHTVRAAAAGLLAGVGVLRSGVADKPVGDFPAWADAHLPHEPAALLGAGEIEQTLTAVSTEDFLGVKRRPVG